MAITTTFSCFIVLLGVFSTFGKSIRQTNIGIVENNVQQILPRGMNVSEYNNMVIRYWTPERMASAKPMDILMIDKNTFNKMNYSPLAKSDKHNSIRKIIRGVPPKSLKASPSVIGKLFVTIGTSNYVCSGSVIASLNGDTLFTAGHCVWDTETQTWASNIMFAPAYSSGTYPYGQWVWRSVAALTAWTQQRNFNYDVAIILAATSDAGEHIRDKTGELAMTIGNPKDAHTDAYGYPVNIYQGQELASCSDQATAASIPQLPDFNGVRLPCNMTGGSSGGPWTQNDSEQTSVNSFGLVGLDDVMFGPYFGDDVHYLWDSYQDQ